MTRFFALFLVIPAAPCAAGLTPPARDTLLISMLLWAAFNLPFIESALHVQARAASAGSE